MLRVLDEYTFEPEGYLYSAGLFAELDLPEAVKLQLQNHRQAEVA
ncbi:MAG: hypothetical protein WBG92_13830 [Thiohalocapsa sp.]